MHVRGCSFVNLNLGLLTAPENTITYHNTVCWSLQILHKHCLRFLLGVKWPQEKLKTMLMQNFGVTNKQYYGMLWYFLEWSIAFFAVLVDVIVVVA